MIRDLLTNEYMARLDVLDLAVKKRLGGISAGARKSTAKGSSLEFSDFREYTQGDDQLRPFRQALYKAVQRGKTGDGEYNTGRKLFRKGLW